MGYPRGDCCLFPINTDRLPRDDRETTERRANVVVTVLQGYCKGIAQSTGEQHHKGSIA